MSVGAAVACAALFAAPAASADAESDAKDLFARARDLRQNGDCAAATPLFRKAYKIYPQAIGSLRNIAECEEQLGHHASARRAWLDIKRALLTLPHDPKYEGWEKDGEEAAKRLEPKVATVFVDVIVKSPEGEGPASEKTGVEIFINGENLGTNLVGTPLERDPGAYKIRVQAPYAQAVEQDVALSAGDSRRLTLRLVQTPPAKPAGEIDTGGGKRTAGWVMIAAGSAALIGSAVTFASRGSAKDEVESGCPTLAGCDPALRDAYDRGKTMSTLTSIFFPAGLVLAAAGTGLVIWGYNSKEPGPSPQAKSFTVTPGLGRVDAVLRF